VVDNNSGVLDYWKLRVSADNGVKKISDIYNVSNGSFISHALRNTIYLPTVNSMLKLDNHKTEALKAMIIIKATELGADGSFNEAYKTISLIPIENRSEYDQIIKINMASNVSDEEYLISLQEFEDKFPNSASSHLRLVDKYIMIEEYDKALNSLKLLEEQVGKDTYIDYSICSVLTMQNKLSEAQSLIEKTISQENNIDYQSLYFEILFKQEYYEECIKILNNMIREFGIEKEELIVWSEDSFPGISEVSEYIKWKNKE